MDKFMRALENHDVTSLQEVPKSDVHNHAGRGGNILDLSSDINPPSKPFDSLNHMQVWFEEEVKTRIPAGLEGFMFRVEASFKQAKRDNIDRLALSFCYGDIVNLGGMEKFKVFIESLKQRYIPQAEFIPEFTLLRSIVSDEEIEKAKEILSFDYFKSIDICGNESAGTLDGYVDLYRFAKSRKVQLKTHVGEFGSAEDVMRAVDLLELDEVHHGIAAANSKACMKYLRDHKVILNVCPMSNILLKRANGYPSHPIKGLIDAGVQVTINTDDLTIFNASVSQEYLNLYDHKVFTAEELNLIRVNGLNAYGKYDGHR